MGGFFFSTLHAPSLFDMATILRYRDLEQGGSLAAGQADTDQGRKAIRKAEAALLRELGRSSWGPCNQWSGDETPVESALYNELRVLNGACSEILVRYQGGFEAPSTQPSDILPGETYVSAPQDLIDAACEVASILLSGQCRGSEDVFDRSSLIDRAIREVRPMISSEHYRRLPFATDRDDVIALPVWPACGVRVFAKDCTFERFFFDPDQDPDAAISDPEYTGANALNELTGQDVVNRWGLVCHPCGGC